MSRQNLRIGVIGFGKMGLLHASIANALPGSEVAAIVDPSTTILNVVKERLPRVRLYGNHGDLLKDGGIDVAFVVTPTSTHTEVALDFVLSGVPVFIEKPLALSGQQAQPLVDAINRRSLPTMVGYMGRYLDTFDKAKTIVACGALGRLQTLRASMYTAQLFQKGKGWRYDRSLSGGGVLITQNSHLVDLLLWMFGSVDWVCGYIISLYSKAVEDQVHAYFKFKSGLTGSMDASWSARHFRKPTMAVHVQGEQGTLDVDDDKVRVFLDEPCGKYSQGWTEWRNPDLYRSVVIDVGGPQYTRQIEDFLTAVRNGQSVESDIGSAYRTQCVIDAVYDSAARDGAPVSP